MSYGAFRLILIFMVVWFTSFPNSVWGKEAANQIPNPLFKLSKPSTGLPGGWHHEARKIPGVKPSRVYLCQVQGYPGQFLAITGGRDRNGRVWCRIDNIRPHTDYQLKFNAYRPKFTNGVYLEVEIFGHRYLINQHFSYGRIQPIFLRINSGNTHGTTRLTIINQHREVLAFGSPSLRLAGPKVRETWQAESVHLPSFFPVGIFGAGPNDLTDIRDAGFNSVQSYDSRPEVIRKMAITSKQLGLRFLPNFRSYQRDISQDLGGNRELLGFYIEDEPEGRSVPPPKIEALKDSLKQDHPGVLTAVAMLRPQMVAEYKNAADVFMLDPYPVPHMPMTWMSDCLEVASDYVAQERLWAVIQAFGGGKFVKDGWPRRPTYLEMRCLTYLAVLHGAHGIFYYSYPAVRSDTASWESLQKIVQELHKLRTWLVVPNSPGSLELEMTSPFKVDGNGRPAVQFCQKDRGAEHLLILVNVIDRPVSFFLKGFTDQVDWLTEIFNQQKSVVLNGNIREKIGPYGVRVYSYRQ